MRTADQTILRTAHNIHPEEATELAVTLSNFPSQALANRLM
jgi:hypothetical protein